MYFGTHTLKGVKLWFIFDGERLSLFPQDAQSREDAINLTHNEVGNGVYFFPGDAIEVDSPLVLPIHLQEKTLVLYPISVTYSVDDVENHTLSVEIGSWFLTDSSTKISGLSLQSDILDRSYDIQRALDVSEFSPDGRIEIISSRKNGHSFKFIFDGKEIEGLLSHSRAVSFNCGEPPIRIRSRLSVVFPETENYTFLQELARSLRGFLAFLAQGHGPQYDGIKLLTRRSYEGTSFLTECADYHENKAESNYVKPEKVVMLNRADTLSEFIFQALADRRIALEHLPKLSERNSYNAARLIMTLAALDKTLALLYKDGITHSKKSLESKRAINETLNQLSKNTTLSRVKRDIGWLQKILNDSESLQSRLSQLSKDHKMLFGKLNSGVFSSSQKANWLLFKNRKQ